MRSIIILPIAYILMFCHKQTVSVAFSFDHQSKHQQKQQKVDVQTSQQQQQPHSDTLASNKNNQLNNNLNHRRRLLHGTASVFAGLLTGSVITTSNNNGINNHVVWAATDNEIFKKNPLTNPILEQIRIWEQAEADNIKYGGELERGDAGNKGQVDAYPKLLVPILQIAYDIEKIQTLVTTSMTVTNYEVAYNLLNDSTKYNKIAFKKIFNAYADNIYYSDPDRANVYLAGGALPKVEQSLAYLLRNDILSNIEDLQAELKYILKNPKEDPNDILLYARNANESMIKYLEVVPPNELQQAKLLLNNQEK